MTTNPNLDQAREWAEGDFDQAYIHAGPRAAAEVINSLPDEWIDADKLREVIGRWDVLLADDDHEDMHGMLDDLRELFPAPQPRTLADMPPEEREACQWMQADFDDGTAERPIRVVITQTGKTTADIILQDGAARWTHFDKLTPLPDLPRMVWPDEQATEEDMSIIPPKIDTSTGHDDHVDMTPEDVPEGEAWLIRHYENADPTPAFRVHGSKYGPRKRWAHYVTGSSMLRFEDDENITLVSRLVPEVKA